MSSKKVSRGPYVPAFERLDERDYLSFKAFPLTYGEPAAPTTWAFELGRLGVAGLIASPTLAGGRGGWSWDDALVGIFQNPEYLSTGTVVTATPQTLLLGDAPNQLGLQLSSFGGQGRWWFDVPVTSPTRIEDLRLTKQQRDAFRPGIPLRPATVPLTPGVPYEMRSLPRAQTETIVYGVATDQPTPGDWDGDGDTELGVFRQGKWYLDTNGVDGWNVNDTTISFGCPGDVGVVGQFQRGGREEIGAFRNGYWYLDSNGNRRWDATDCSLHFGQHGDLPFVGDWNGDGVSEVGVLRGNRWYLDTNGSRGWQGDDLQFQTGLVGDLPIVGDWNGDGRCDIGVYRRSTGQWIFDTDGDRRFTERDLVIDHDVGSDTPVITVARGLTLYQLARRISGSVPCNDLIRTRVLLPNEQLGGGERLMTNHSVPPKSSNRPAIRGETIRSPAPVKTTIDPPFYRPTQRGPADIDKAFISVRNESTFLSGLLLR